MDGYRATMRYAKQAFGDTVVRKLTVGHVRAFLRVCSEARHGPKAERAMSDSTRAKHLRVVGVCLERPVKAGYAGPEPGPHGPTGERPRGRRQEAAYFENDELPRLFAALRTRGSTYRVLFEVALKTGMRQGELLELNNRPIFWLSKHLGRSSVDVTSNVYGHLATGGRRR